jgi:hypothetical protein
MNSNTRRLRNIGVIAHVDAGKIKSRSAPEPVGTSRIRLALRPATLLGSMAAIL